MTGLFPPVRQCIRQSRLAFEYGYSWLGEAQALDTHSARGQASGDPGAVSLHTEATRTEVVEQEHGASRARPHCPRA
jgi:hypothetical protein